MRYSKRGVRNMDEGSLMGAQVGERHHHGNRTRRLKAPVLFSLLSVMVAVDRDHQHHLCYQPGFAT